MNTKFSYLYQDGSGHRYFAERTFAGTPTPEQIERLRRAMRPADDAGTYRFVAEQVGLPSVFPWVADLPGTEAAEFRPRQDPLWHEVALGVGDDVEPGLLVSTEEPDDGRSLEQFVGAVERAAREGWNTERSPDAQGGALGAMDSVDEVRD